LIKILDNDLYLATAPLSQIKVLSYKEKDEWTLQSKYNIGKKRQD
jgi:hypothetical protein